MSDLSKLLSDIRSNEDPADPMPSLGDSSSDGIVRSELFGVRRRLHARLAEELGGALYRQDLSPDRLREMVADRVKRLLNEEPTPMSADERDRLIADIEADVMGHGPIEELLKDPSVTEIMVNGPKSIYVERDGKIVKSNRRFADETHLRAVIDGIVARVGRRIDESSPMVDARLADGSRVNAIIHPLAVGGPFLTVRKFSAEPYSQRDLVGFGTMTAEAASFLEACTRGRLSMLITGGTGAGKTTTLNVTSSFIPPDERIVTIEDAVELRLAQPHVLQLEARPPNIEGAGEVTIRELVRNALRMRPDRIVVGEVRGGEALDMLQAMNTGHE
jgi:pilus assembly protein CpaF